MTTSEPSRHGAMRTSWSRRVAASGPGGAFRRLPPRRSMLRAATALPVLAASGCRLATPDAEELMCTTGAASDSPAQENAMADDAPSKNRRLSPAGLALSPDGRFAVANESPDWALLGRSDSWGSTVWDTGTGEIVRRLANRLTGAIAWHPSEDLIAVGGSTTVVITDPEGSVSWTLSGHSAPRSGVALIRDLAFSPDGSMLASLSSDGTVGVWSLATGACNAALRLGVRRLDPRSLAFSPDGSSLVISGPQGAPERWDVTTGKRTDRLKDVDGRPYGVAHSAGGDLLIGTDEPTALHILYADGASAQGPTPLSRRPLWIAPSGDGRIAVGGENDNQVMLWDPTTDERTDLPRVKGSVGRLVWSPDGSTLYGASPAEGILAWSGQEWTPFALPDT